MVGENSPQASIADEEGGGYLVFKTNGGFSPTTRCANTPKDLTTTDSKTMVGFHPPQAVTSALVAFAILAFKNNGGFSPTTSCRQNSHGYGAARIQKQWWVFTHHK
ncbi:MAG TPA: hypothetical protein VIE65_08815, partial [Methylobacter sp.]